jgi:hypothetical protein
VRSYRLARVAAQAEILRVRHLLRRQVIRAALAAGAVVFVLAALVGLHVAAVMALEERVTPIEAVAIVAAADAVIAIVLAILAARDVPGLAEQEALRVRRLAVEEAVETAVVIALLRRLLRVRSFADFRDVVVATLAAWMVGGKRH